MESFIYPIVVWTVQLYKGIERKLYALFQNRIKEIIKTQLSIAGIKINGSNSFDLKVHNENFYNRVAVDGTLGIGEAYMEGWFDCEALDEYSFRMFSSEVYQNSVHSINQFINYLLYHLFNLQTKERAFEVGIKHYDTGNDFFESVLDSTMNYSCGYWRRATNLEQAQLDKMELIAQKLKLKPGMRVLDIGCGWGSLCKYLAEKYAVEVVGITISEEGAKWARTKCRKLPVEIRVQDYRDVNEVFDRIAAIGALEHVGPSNYRTFMEVAHRCLTDDGIFLLHTIGVNHKRVPRAEPWFHKYIFPNGVLSYYKDIPNSIENLFIIEDWHNFGYDYSKTLIAWYENLVKAWPKKLDYKGEQFFRMWKYYLLVSAGAFRSRRFQLWQVVLTKNGYEGGYQAPR